MSESNAGKMGVKRRTRRLVQERRDKMIEMHASGIGKSEMFDEIANLYHVSRGSVQNDWQRRKKWMPEQLLDEGESGERLKEAIGEYLNELKIVRAHLWTSLMEADNSSAKVHVLRCLARSMIKEIKMMQSLGMLPDIPRKMKCF